MSDMSDLDKLLRFTEFTHKFQQVKRQQYAVGENRYENDSEHSFQLAMICWYIISFKKLDYNIDKILKYSLVHDLVEAYAGDSYFIGEARESKKQRESEALEQIKNDFPEFSDLPILIKNYENRVDSESKFVYCVEKLIPNINLYFDNGRGWQEHEITIDTLINNKAPKVKSCEDLVEIWDEFEKLLQNNKQMFYEE